MVGTQGLVLGFEGEAKGIVLGFQGERPRVQVSPRVRLGELGHLGLVSTNVGFDFVEDGMKEEGQPVPCPWVYGVKGLGFEDGKPQKLCKVRKIFHDHPTSFRRSHTTQRQACNSTQARVPMLEASQVKNGLMKSSNSSTYQAQQKEGQSKSS